MKKFYATLVFSYFSDMALLLAVIWITLTFTGSPLFLGVTLSVSITVPFIIRKFFPHIDLVRINLNNLYKLRILIYTVILLIALSEIINIYTLLILSLLTGTLNLSTLSSYEATNAQLVLLNEISANKAARIMQTVIQIGAFLGSAIGGFLLKKQSAFTVLALISLIDLLACFLFLLALKPLFSKLLINSMETKEDYIDSVTTSFSSQFASKKSFVFLCLVLGGVGFHIATFNMITPILFLEIRQWDASVFGLSSAVAGVGAFLAVFCSIKRSFLLFPLILVMSDLVFGFSEWKFLTISICFFIGFSINTIRINIREQLILLTSSPVQAKIMGEMSAVYYSFFQSIAPVSIGVLVNAFNNIHFNQAVLGVVALLITMLIFSRYRVFVVIKE